ncbi:MAG TPA: hypothetical protein VGG64_11510 [Pirellulales bacterium]|jgi:hypothetical protein
MHVPTLTARLAFFCVVMGIGTVAQAAKPDNGASTSRSARDDATRIIPQDKLTPDGQQKVASVLQQVSIFRRLPTQVIECDPNMYLFLVEHPDLVVNMWEVMDVSDMRLEKTGPDTYRANDGVGTEGHVEYLYRSFDTHIMYAEGAYTGPMFVNPVHGKCLLILKTGYVREPNNRYYITCRLDTFIQLKNVGLEIVARTFQPLVGKTADHNFRETASFMAMVSRSAESRPRALQQLTAQLTKISDEDRDEFADIANQLTLTAVERNGDTERAMATPNSQRKTVMKPTTSGGR